MAFSPNRFRLIQRTLPTERDGVRRPRRPRRMNQDLGAPPGIELWPVLRSASDARIRQTGRTPRTTEPRWNRELVPRWQLGFCKPGRRLKLVGRNAGAFDAGQGRPIMPLTIVPDALPDARETRRIAKFFQASLIPHRPHPGLRDEVLDLHHW